MKYIMFYKKMTAISVRHPIIFPNHLVHADVAKMLTCDIGPLAGFIPETAGTVILSDAECSGDSKTLGIMSKPARDSQIIIMNDYGGGMP